MEDNKDEEVLTKDIPSEVEIAIENEADKSTSSQKIIIDEPMVGLVFNSPDDVYVYYTNYARNLGFGIAKRTKKLGEEGELKYFTLQCSRAGKRQNGNQDLKPRLSTKTMCQAYIRASLQKDGKFRLTTVSLKHNHDLSPGKARYFRCNKSIDDGVKRRLELNDQAGIGLSKNFNSLVVEAGSYDNLTFCEKDCRNHIDKARRLRLGIGDGEAIRNYFQRMQENNTKSFYLMDLDDESRVKNVFWADARSREAYKAFGDVISFDTTYLTNKYDMPFAPFVGVNHHGQSILLGCGLLSNETTDTFVWLFQSWLSCMSGISPKAIITDQCQAMKRAVEIVFPNTRHRWCLWHIMKKIPEKLRGYARYEGIKVTLQKVVYESLTKIEFEEMWGKLIEKYDLSQNEWVKGLYNEKERWVPIFVKDTFWAGMSTTQRSESMNAFFDGYVNSKTTLKQFVEQYDNALKNKIEKEKQADFHSFNSLYECLTIYPIERQFQEAYTNAKFKEFQEELKKLIYCNAQFVAMVGVISKYAVTEATKVGDKIKSRVLDVYFNDDEFEVNCMCRLFQFKGIMCVHSLSVLALRKIEMVPPKYILPRWRKDMKREYTFVTTSYNNISCEPSMLRYDRMCTEFFEVGKMAADCEDKCDLVISCVRELKAKLRAVDTMPENDAPVIGTKKGESESSVLNECNKVCSPVARKRKGRPPSKRKISNVEKAIQRVKKKKMKQVGECKSTNTKGKKLIFSCSLTVPENNESSSQACSPA